jgi:hypothetical protein
METTLPCGCVSEIAGTTSRITTICEKHKNTLDAMNKLRPHLLEFLRQDGRKVLIASLYDDGSDVYIRTG